MKVDETGEPWPYETREAVVGEAPPTWDCPGGECVCHPATGEAARAKHRIVFFDHAAVRMPRARCRVIENGRLLNAHAPNAGPDGSLDVEPVETTRTLILEWAPADMPKGARYPYTKTYHVAHHWRVEQGVETRLQNLGFWAYSSLRKNVSDFQRSYHMKQTGHAADVDEVLRRFHDDGLLPPVLKAKQGPPSTTEALVQAAPGQDTPSDGAPHGEDPPDPPPPGGGSGGGVPPQGAAAAIQTTRLRIELVRAFALFDEDFDKDDDVLVPPWDGEPSSDGSHSYGTYDAHRMLRDLYPNEATRKNRWAAGGVAGATVTLSDGSGERIDEQTTDGHGAAVFDIGLLPETSALICDVAPPPGQLNEVRAAAGPGMTDETTDARFLYRPFSMTLNLDATRGVVLDSISVLPSERPRFARLLGADAGNKANTIRIDWRPDWIRAGRRKMRDARLIDPVDTPLNPFDLSLPASDREQQAPPAIMIHGTATHNFPAIVDHLLDSVVNGSHYWVDFDGFVVKMVDEFYKTNHAGESLWVQKGSTNQYAVGIETMHMDTTEPQTEEKKNVPSLPRRYTKEQYATLIRLCRELRAQYPILRRHVIGHTDPYVAGAVTKKDGQRPIITNATHKARGCPGDYFDWQRLEDAGVALKPWFPIADPPAWSRFN